MNKFDFIDAVNLVDDDLLLEAENYRADKPVTSEMSDIQPEKKSRSSAFYIIPAAAACAAVILTVNHLTSPENAGKPQIDNLPVSEATSSEKFAEESLLPADTAVISEAPTADSVYSAEMSSVFETAVPSDSETITGEISSAAERTTEAVKTTDEYRVTFTDRTVETKPASVASPAPSAGHGSLPVTEFHPVTSAEETKPFYPQVTEGQRPVVTESVYVTVKHPESPVPEPVDRESPNVIPSSPAVVVPVPSSPAAVPSHEVIRPTPSATLCPAISPADPSRPASAPVPSASLRPLPSGEDVTSPSTAGNAAGDINADGAADVTDLSYLSLYLIGDIEFTDAQKKAADTDKDGEVKLADLATFRQYLSKITDLPGQ